MADIFTTNLTDGSDIFSFAGLDVDIPWTINALAGNDRVTVTGGWMTICNMGTGNDVLRVTGGSYVTCNGEDGNDRLDMYAASSTLIGGGGADVANVYGGFHLGGNGGVGKDIVHFYADVLANFDGGADNDAFYGNGHVVSGVIVGGNGNDQYSGFVAAGGNPLKLAGGPGNDIYSLNSATATIVEAAGQGIDRVNASVSFILAPNVEQLVLTGGAAINGTGNGGDNWLSGNTAANTLLGSLGSDHLFGRAGADVLNGGDGIDFLSGGIGRDQYYGGAGADRFLFDDGEFAGSDASTCDRIHDFAADDYIFLRNADANSNLAGDQNFAFIGTAAFTGVAGQLRYAELGGNTYVQGDVDGDGAADFWIRIDGSWALTGGDFVL